MKWILANLEMENYYNSAVKLLLLQSRECSQPCPLIHGHTLTMGSTTLTIHIHSGWETCTFCDPAQREGQEQLAGENTRETRAQEELDVLRRKELNRIKKKYGLRVCQ